MVEDDGDGEDDDRQGPLSNKKPSGASHSFPLVSTLGQQAGNSHEPGRWTSPGSCPASYRPSSPSPLPLILPTDGEEL